MGSFASKVPNQIGYSSQPFPLFIPLQIYPKSPSPFSSSQPPNPCKMVFFKKVSLALALTSAFASAAPQQLLQLGNGQLVRLAGLDNVADINLSGARLVSAVNAVPSTTVVRTAAPAATVVNAVPSTVRLVEQIDEEVLEVTGGDPNYSFGYSVADAVSGDAKTREETREGNAVSGSYTVADPDGRVRRVEYYADANTGFQARVTYDGQEGPVAIPIDSAPAGEAVTVVQDPDVIIAQRAESEALLARLSATPSVVRTVAQPATVSHVSLAVAQPSIVRTFSHPATVSHVSHAVAQPSVVRNFASPAVVRTTTSHVNHVEPTVVRSNGAVHRLHNAAVPTVVSRTTDAVVSPATATAVRLNNAAGSVFRLANGQIVTLG